MILAVDIGNTRISFALVKNNKVFCVESIETKEINNIPKVLKRFSKNVLDKAVICSVVPKMNNKIIKEIKKICRVDAKLAGPDIKVPIRNNYKKPKQVGADRLTCAFAAKEIYGYPSVVIDFGTAITFDIISKDGSYEGGMIIPGIRLSLESLHNKTALLPKIENIAIPKHLIGKETKESILSGVFNGYGEMCNGLVNLLSKRIGGKPKFILTGGYANLMAKYIKTKCIVDKELIFKGMGRL